MQEDQNFFAIHFELSDRVNTCYNLKEKIPESQDVRKFLRSLLERFKHKPMTIEESKDIDSMKVDECVESL